MLPGERHKERVLNSDEEELFFEATRSEAMMRHQDPQLLHDGAGILIDCALRPEECFRLRAEYISDGVLEIPYGKSENARRRRIPVTSRVKAILDMRLQIAEGGPWVFPAKTMSGHIEPSSLKKQHPRALRVSGVEPFDLYTLRHTCLTRWAPHMDPWTLAYLAGLRDMNITKRYVHPQEHTIREAMDEARNARGGRSFGHNAESATLASRTESAAIN
jgi:integrase